MVIKKSVIDLLETTFKKMYVQRMNQARISHICEMAMPIQSRSRIRKRQYFEN